MSKIAEQERLETLGQVHDALSVFNDINAFYSYASNINEQLKAAPRLAMQSSKAQALKEYKPANKSDRDAEIEYAAKFVIFLAIFFGFFMLIDGHTIGLLVCIAIIVIDICYIWRANERKSTSQCVRRIVSGPLKSISKQEELSYTEDIKTISNAITKTMLQNREILSKIPRDYRNYDAVTYFENVLANQRAYSMQEAVNLYEQHLYQLRMEDKNRQLLEQAQKQTRLLREIEFNTDFATTYMIIRDILG